MCFVYGLFKLSIIIKSTTGTTDSNKRKEKGGLEDGTEPTSKVYVKVDGVKANHSN